MAGNIANPRIWSLADVYTAPLGTTAPTDVSTSWGGSWAAVGLISEDGMSLDINETLTKFYAYGNIFIRTARSKHDEDFKFKCLEDNATVFGLVRPGSSESLAGGVTTRTIVQAPSSNIRAFGVELTDGTIIKRRIFPRAEVTAVGTQNMSDNGLADVELTVSIYGNWTELTNDTAA